MKGNAARNDPTPFDLRNANNSVGLVNFSNQKQCFSTCRLFINVIFGTKNSAEEAPNKTLWPFTPLPFPQTFRQLNQFCVYFPQQCFIELMGIVCIKTVAECCQLKVQNPEFIYGQFMRPFMSPVGFKVNSGFSNDVELCAFPCLFRLLINRCRMQMTRCL
jgi:hypothetical protein